jgi:hypothetical protein
MSISGSVLASYWRQRPAETPAPDASLAEQAVGVKSPSSPIPLAEAGRGEREIDKRDTFLVSPSPRFGERGPGSEGSEESRVS